MAFSAFWISRLHAHRSGPLPWVAELGFFQNYVLGVWPHTWSLAVEEHFYILLALVVWRLSKAQRLDLLPMIGTCVLVGCLGMRAVTTLVLRDGGFRFYQEMAVTHLRLDSLMVGVMLSYWRYFGAKDHWVRRISGPMPIVAGIICFIPAFLFPIESVRWMPVFGPVFCYLGAGMLVVSIGQWRTQNRAALFIASFGAASYSTYLWHMVALDIAIIVQRRLGADVLMPLYFLGSFAAGWFFTAVIERPFLALRNRLTEGHDRRTRLLVPADQAALRARPASTATPR